MGEGIRCTPGRDNRSAAEDSPGAVDDEEGLASLVGEDLSVNLLSERDDGSYDERGYNLVISNTDEKLEREQEYFSILSQQLIAGVILAPAPGDVASRRYLFGARPAFGDFGLFAQLYEALTDPTPGALMRAEAPRVRMPSINVVSTSSMAEPKSCS